MGDYRVVIEATGGHGCQREKRDGAVVGTCDSPGCPDCRVRALVKDLRATGNTVKSATLTHWPGEQGEVTDDLVSGVRRGSF